MPQSLFYDIHVPRFVSWRDMSNTHLSFWHNVKNFVRIKFIIMSIACRFHFVDVVLTMNIRISMLEIIFSGSVAVRNYPISVITFPKILIIWSNNDSNIVYFIFKKSLIICILEITRVQQGTAIYAVLHKNKITEKLQRSDECYWQCLIFSYLCNTNKKKWWMLLTVSDLFLIFATQTKEVINVIDSVWSLQHKRKKWWMLLRASVLSSSYHCNTKQTTMILFLLRPSTNLKFPNQSNVSEKMLEFPLSSVQDGNYRIKAHKSAFARCRCFYSELKGKTILDFFYFLSPVRCRYINIFFIRKINTHCGVLLQIYIMCMYTRVRKTIWWYERC